MRNSVLGLVLVSSMAATPASARDGDVYLTLQGGVTDIADADVDVDQASNAMAITTNAGWEYGALLGYDFGGFRLEAEGTRQTAKMQQLRGSDGFDVDVVSPGVQELASIRGDIDIDSLMANALLDLGGNDGVVLYAGGGVGYAWTATEGSIDGVVGPFVDDSDAGLAWQLLAGVGVPITSGVELGAKYRYFNIGGLEMSGPLGREYDTGYSTHSLLATLTFNFGGTSPPSTSVPLPRTAPPPPPPPPAMKTCWNGSSVPVEQSCPTPPPLPVPPTGERG
jgi:opacity protein-like surface antigen